MKKKIKIEKSRILLKQALIHLLLEKSYTSISIQELCKEAKVGPPFTTITTTSVICWKAPLPITAGLPRKQR